MNMLFRGLIHNKQAMCYGSQKKKKKKGTRIDPAEYGETWWCGNILLETQKEKWDEEFWRVITTGL